MNAPETSRNDGLPFAVAAYLVWGLLPLYMSLVRHVPALEFLGWRVVFTLPVCLLIVAVRRQGPQVLEALRSPRLVALLLASALLIGANWLIYIVGILNGHVLAASLGYYINPLLNVLAGTLFLGERLNRRQWLAVGIAAAGVSLLAWDAREMLGISLGLAITFAGYGLVRRSAPVGSLPGLTIETLLLLVPALGLLAWQGAGAGSLSLGQTTQGDVVLALSGVVTAVPLLLFAVAARRMDYSLLGFVQFLAPTIIFLLGLFVFREPLRDVQMACFALIWSAVALFIWDLLARRKSQS